MTQETKAKATMAALAATGATAAVAESYIYLIAKIKQKNGGTFKLLDAKDIDWAGFDWSTSGVPTYTLPAATDKTLGGVKIGANITNTDGTISLTGDNVKAALGYTPVNETDFNNAINGMTWKGAVADAAALKAVKSPKDTETRALLDTNAIYQFNDSDTATEDQAPDVYVPDDGTKGAWRLLSHLVYAPATQQADGLMSATDKTKLDALPAKADLDASLSNLKKQTSTAGTFFATSDVGSDTDVPLANITIPAGISIKVGDNIIDSEGGQYTVTTVNTDSVHVSAVGLQLAKKSDMDALKTIVNGIKTDLSAYQKTADADAKYATKADVEVVSDDFITGLFA